jgi:cyclophilin family peptidyl-prolyl cis-trans isomerase
MRFRISSSALCLLLLSGVDCYAQQENHALLDPNDKAWATDAPDVYKVRLGTSQGDIVIEVHKEWAPLGASRFYNLVRLAFFDDSRFYRIRAGAFAQFGIAGKPAIAKVWEHQSFADDAVKQSNLRGTIAFAMTGPNARTTQLYINLKDNVHQDAQGFAPIGRVVSGMDVADRLYAGYGESSGGGMRGGKQARLFEEGNLYLDKEFPMLDKIFKAEIIK